MSRYASKDVVITYDGNNITQYVDSINGMKVSQLMADSNPFGTDWQGKIPTGTKKHDDVVLKGFYDDAANGPKALFGPAVIDALTPNTVAKNLVVTIGGTNTRTVPVFPADWEEGMVSGQVHTYTSTLTKAPGDVTIA